MLKRATHFLSCRKQVVVTQSSIALHYDRQYCLLDKNIVELGDIVYCVVSLFCAITDLLLIGLYSPVDRKSFCFWKKGRRGSLNKVLPKSNPVPYLQTDSHK